MIDGPRIHLDRDRYRRPTARRRSRRATSTWRTGREHGVPREIARALPAHARRSSSRTKRGTSAGDGDFTGTFHLFKGGHDLSGTFTSDAALGVNDYRFPALYGSLRWTPHGFDVWDAGAKFVRRRREVRVFDQAARRARRAPTARFDATYTERRSGAPSPTSSSFTGLRFAGAATGRQSARVAARAASPTHTATGSSSSRRRRGRRR